jgi:hypothetical protein
VEEKATLEGMVESCDELLVEIARETELDRMGEDDEDEEEDVDAYDEGDVAAPLVPAPPTTTPEEINDEGPIEMVPEQEAPMAHEVILANVELEIPQFRLYHTLMRDYKESPPRMMEDMDDLDDGPNEGRSNMDEWFPEGGNNNRD